MTSASILEVHSHLSKCGPIEYDIYEVNYFGSRYAIKTFFKKKTVVCLFGGEDIEHSASTGVSYWTTQYIPIMFFIIMIIGYMLLLLQQFVANFLFGVEDDLFCECKRNESTFPQ